MLGHPTAAAPAAILSITRLIFFSPFSAISVRQVDIASKASFTASCALAESPGTNIGLKFRGVVSLVIMADLPFILQRIRFFSFTHNSIPCYARSSARHSSGSYSKLDRPVSFTRHVPRNISWQLIARLQIHLSMRNSYAAIRIWNRLRRGYRQAERLRRSAAGSRRSTRLHTTGCWRWSINTESRSNRPKKTVGTSYSY